MTTDYEKEYGPTEKEEPSIEVKELINKNEIFLKGMTHTDEYGGMVLILQNPEKELAIKTYNPLGDVQVYLSQDQAYALGKLLLQYAQYGTIDPDSTTIEEKETTNGTG